MRRLAVFFLLVGALLVPTASASNLVVWSLVGVDVSSVSPFPAGTMTGYFTYDSSGSGSITDWNLTISGVSRSVAGDSALNGTWAPGTGMSVEPLDGTDLNNGIRFVYTGSSAMSWIALDWLGTIPLDTPGRIDLRVGGASEAGFSASGGGNNESANITAGALDSTAPEPGVCILAGTGLVGLALLRRKAARKAQ